MCYIWKLGSGAFRSFRWFVTLVPKNWLVLRDIEIWGSGNCWRKTPDSDSMQRQRAFILQKQPAWGLEGVGLSTMFWNGDPRQRCAGLLTGNRENSLEGLGHLKFHWWMLGGHRCSVVCIPISCLTIGWDRAAQWRWPKIFLHFCDYP